VPRGRGKAEIVHWPGRKPTEKNQRHEKADDEEIIVNFKNGEGAYRT
jgi:hypothetical protein